MRQKRRKNGCFWLTSPQCAKFLGFYANSLYVKDCEMVEKKGGKEKEKSSTMPDVLIKGYKILRTVSVGQGFSFAEVEHRLIYYDS